MTSHRSSEPTTLARVREVFSSSGFTRLFTTRVVSQLGDGIFQLAAAKILLFDHPGTNPALTLTAISTVTLVPFSLVSPFVGVFIDRWDRRKILEWTPALRAVLALLLSVIFSHESTGPLFYAIVLIVLSSNRLFLATMSAVLPQFVPTDDLLVANSAATTGGSIANVAGLGLGAVLSAGIGGTRTAVFAGVAFAAAALMARTLPIRDERPAVRGRLGDHIRLVTREMIAGVREVRSSRPVTFALSAVSVTQLLVGAMTGATAFYFIRTLRLGVGSVSGLLLTLLIGIGAGVVMVPIIARRVRRTLLIPLSFAIAGVAVLLSGVWLSRVAITAGAIFVGIAYSMTKIPVDTIVQEEMPDSFRGRAFALYDMLFSLARVAGTGFAGVVVGALSPGGMVASIGAAYLIASAAFAGAERRLAGVRRLRKSRPAPPPQPALQLPAGEMVTVRTYAGHRADTEPRAIVVGDREVPVDEICWRAIEERGGERKQIFVIRVGGTRVRIASSEESSRWEVERVIASKPTEKE